MSKTKHIIWSNLNLDLDDWMDGLRENNEINGLNPDDYDEDEYYRQMVETNDEYISDERINLSVYVGQIIAIADLGLWHGRRSGYKMIDSGVIGDCLYGGSCDYCEWYVDEKGDLRFTGHHHDGSNFYVYRAIRPDTSDDKLEELKAALWRGDDCEKMIQKYTDRLGDYIGDVYGWKFRYRRKSTVNTAYRV